MGPRPTRGSIGFGGGLGEDEGAAGQCESYEKAGPLVAIVKRGGDTGSVQDEHPEKKHDAEPRGCETRKFIDRDAERGGGEADAGEIYPEQVRGNPGRHERRDEVCVHEVLHAENQHGKREQPAA